MRSLAVIIIMIICVPERPHRRRVHYGARRHETTGIFQLKKKKHFLKNCYSEQLEFFLFFRLTTLVGGGGGGGKVRFSGKRNNQNVVFAGKNDVIPCAHDGFICSFRLRFFFS